jgi:hypothetical protein
VDIFSQATKSLNIFSIVTISQGIWMANKNVSEWTTLKIRKLNVNRLFKLKKDKDDTNDDVITRMLDEKEAEA